MCGICGIISKRPLGAREVTAVRAMNAALIHRGPDSSGEYQGQQVMLAMRRLSIIDLQGAHQPLWNEDRTLALIVNGEIYNFKELREDLIRKGHTFATTGDCETILHLYEDHGADCVDSLRGMFAFALWDVPRRRLLLARDRLGEKPLYLFETEDRILFASELRALQQSRMFPFALDPVSVDWYFHYGYVPEPRVPVAGVRKLDAGCRLMVDLQPWRKAESRYWDMEAAPPLEGNPVERIRTELDTLSELVIRSDVPVGIALSGGLDSSAIALLSATKYPGQMHAFSVGYPGRPKNDERAEARRLADHLSMPFHDVELETGAMVESFPELVWKRDDPIADISGYGYYAVARLAREHGVPVLMQGQGSDELFWGYPWVSAAVDETLDKRRTAAWGSLMLPKYLRLDMPGGWEPWRIRLWLQKACGLQAGWRLYQHHKSLPSGRMVFYDKHMDFQEAMRKTGSLYSPEFKARLGAQSAADVFTFPDLKFGVDVRMTSLIMNTYLRENGVAQADRLSMASSVEMRLPFLDYRLVETVIGFRKRFKDYRLTPKAWLKQALVDVLPDWVVKRPKRGFQPPVREWYEALHARYGRTMLDGCLVGAGVLQADAARRLVTGPIPHTTVTPLVFKALVLELWCQGMQASLAPGAGGSTAP